MTFTLVKYTFVRGHTTTATTAHMTINTWKTFVHIFVPLVRVFRCLFGLLFFFLRLLFVCLYKVQLSQISELFAVTARELSKYKHIYMNTLYGSIITLHSPYKIQFEWNNEPDNMVFAVQLKRTKKTTEILLSASCSPQKDAQQQGHKKKPNCSEHCG